MAGRWRCAGDHGNGPDGVRRRRATRRHSGPADAGGQSGGAGQRTDCPPGAVVAQRRDRFADRRSRQQQRPGCRCRRLQWPSKPAEADRMARSPLFDGVSPSLLNAIKRVGDNYGPYGVRITSAYRPGSGHSQHGRGKAIDVELYDKKTGKAVPNYQNAESAATYQAFANAVYADAQKNDPALAAKLRWGGYFGNDPGTGKPTIRLARPDALRRGRATGSACAAARGKRASRPRCRNTGRSPRRALPEPAATGGRWLRRPYERAPEGPAEGAAPAGTSVHRGRPARHGGPYPRRRAKDTTSTRKSRCGWRSPRA